MRSRPSFRAAWSPRDGDPAICLRSPWAPVSEKTRGREASGVLPNTRRGLTSASALARTLGQGRRPGAGGPSRHSPRESRTRSRSGWAPEHVPESSSSRLLQGSFQEC